MDLTHRFTVPASVEETWAAFQDIESVAGCFPGAVVTEVDGDDFKGSAKVKLGPISLVYNGSGSFLEKDEAARKFVVVAKGKDKRGNGTAGATVTATMAADGAESTNVEVVTDLAITGKPAQFGRGVIQDVSDKLLQQFVDCLQDKVGSPEPPAEEEAAAPAAAVTETESPDPPAPSSAATSSGGARKAPASTYGGAQAGSSPTSSARSAGAGSDDALDLGATVLPILAKTYWKQALGAFVVLVVLVSIIRKVLR